MTTQDNKGLEVGPDGQLRCWWHGGHEDYMKYHDEEWGRPVADDHRLFEKIILEGFQAGLSWLTILRKRVTPRNDDAAASSSWLEGSAKPQVPVHSSV